MIQSVKPADLALSGPAVDINVGGLSRALAEALTAGFAGGTSACW